MQQSVIVITAIIWIVLPVVWLDFQLTSYFWSLDVCHW